GQSAHDGQIQATQSYTAFGGNLNATGTSNALQKYTGREADSESGCYYYRARIYCPEMGRFISEDPLGFEAGVNFYAYVNNNPVNANDPSGKIVVNPITIGATIGGVTGAIQAANAGGGWTIDNAGNIAIGALTGAVAGAIPGAVATNIGLKATVAVGALAAGGGNLANQWAGGTSLGNTNWPQFSVQTGLGGISGLAGYGAGLSSALKVVRSGGSVEGALNFGNIYGALAGGATQTIANLPVPTDLGGFWSSTNLPATNSANGGFVLYPNKSNTNQMQSVYRK
ncbi:MAG: RHS repeat-associated core domain-containing protein, partial [Methylomonas sp.]|uniref:RHS repeat-associated core domain-containing protein n=1 Tax=Methylomonas sp. TaxID=418 RepID=UPI0025F01864